MKRIAILIAAAAVAAAPAAAVQAKPPKAPERAAKAPKAKTKPASAQRLCREERAALGPAAFAAKYGKPRTKGSAKARAKLARAAFGRCVAQTGKRLRAERRAAAEQEADAEESKDAEDARDDADDADDGDAAAGKADAAAGEPDAALDDHAPDRDTKPEPGDDTADDEPAAGLDGDADLG